MNRQLEDRLESIFDGKNFPSRDDRKIAAFLDRDYDVYVPSCVVDSVFPMEEQNIGCVTKM